MTQLGGTESLPGLLLISAALLKLGAVFWLRLFWCKTGAQNDKEK